MAFICQIIDSRYVFFFTSYILLPDVNDCSKFMCWFHLMTYAFIRIGEKKVNCDHLGLGCFNKSLNFRKDVKSLLIENQNGFRPPITITY